MDAVDQSHPRDGHRDVHTPVSSVNTAGRVWMQLSSHANAPRLMAAGSSSRGFVLFEPKPSQIAPGYFSNRSGDEQRSNLGDPANW